MPQPTTGEFLNTTTPAAPDGNQPVVFQSDGETPQQSITAYPQIATTELAGVVIPDGESITIDPDTGIISADSSGVAGSIQQGEYISAQDIGTANAYAVTLTPAPTIVQGSMVAMLAANPNDGPSTLSVNGGDPAPITDNGQSPLVGGEINAGQWIVMMFDGTNFQIVGGNSGGSSSGAPTPVVPTGAIDGSNVDFTIPTAGAGNLYRNGILQNPFGDSPDYVITGVNIVMAAAPSAGTQPDWLIWVYLAGDPGPTGPVGPVTPTEVQQQAFTYVSEDTGSANAYAIAQTPAPTIVEGSKASFKAANPNTGPSTLAVNGGTAYPITKSGTTVLAGGEIVAGQIIDVTFDGANWQMPAGVTGSTLPTADFVQGAAQYFFGSPNVLAFPSDNTAGNCLIVEAAQWEGFEGEGTISISDSQGNTYVPVFSGEYISGSNVILGLWYAANCKGGANSVTVSYTGFGQSLGLVIHEYSNIETVSPLDSYNSGLAADSGQVPPSVSLRTTVAGDLLHVCFLAWASDWSGSPIAQTGDWTQRESLYGDAPGYYGPGMVTCDTGAPAVDSFSNGSTNPHAGSVRGATFMIALKAGSGGGGAGGVSSFNGRTGAVEPASGDYTAAEVTNAADTSAANTFAGVITAEKGIGATGDDSAATITNTTKLFFNSTSPQHGGLYVTGPDSSTVPGINIFAASDDFSKQVGVLIYVASTGLATIGPGLVLPLGYVLGIDGSSASLASNGTIAITNPVSVVAPTGDVTGVILAAGSTAGEVQTVINNSSHTITFAASGTSHIADGTSDVIAANTAGMYIWSGSLWFRK